MKPNAFLILILLTSVGCGSKPTDQSRATISPDGRIWIIQWGQTGEKLDYLAIAGGRGEVKGLVTVVSSSGGRKGITITSPDGKAFHRSGGFKIYESVDGKYVEIENLPVAPEQLSAFLDSGPISYDHEVLKKYIEQ